MNSSGIFELKLTQLSFSHGERVRCTCTAACCIQPLAPSGVNKIPSAIFFSICLSRLSSAISRFTREFPISYSFIRSVYSPASAWHIPYAVGYRSVPLSRSNGLPRCRQLVRPTSISRRRFTTRSGVCLALRPCFAPIKIRFYHPNWNREDLVLQSQQHINSTVETILECLNHERSCNHDLMKCLFGHK